MNSLRYEDVIFLLSNDFPLEKYDLINFDTSLKPPFVKEEEYDVIKKKLDKFAKYAGTKWQDLPAGANIHPMKALMDVSNKKNEIYQCIVLMVKKNCTYYKDKAPLNYAAMIKVREELLELALLNSKKFYQSLIENKALIEKAYYQGLKLFKVKDVEHKSIVGSIDKGMLAEHIFKLVKDDDPETLKLILKLNIDVNRYRFGPTQKSLLSIALEQRSFRTAKALIKAGADINGHFSGSKAGNSFLQHAVLTNDIDLVEFLLSNGATPNKPNYEGQAPLHNAVYRSNLRMVNLLIGYGANPDIADAVGDTPLHYATRKFKSDIFASLILGGADPVLKNQQKRTPHKEIHHISMSYIITPAGGVVTFLFLFYIIGYITEFLMWGGTGLTLLAVIFAHFSYSKKKIDMLDRKIIKNSLSKKKKNTVIK